MRIPRLAALWAVVAIVLAACTGGGASPSASSGGSGAATACKVGVSWNNYEQPRWAATDQPNIKGAIEAAGGTYTEAFAQDDDTQQLTDVENLINQDVNVLILLAKNLTDNPAGPAKRPPTPASRSSRMTAWSRIRTSSTSRSTTSASARPRPTRCSTRCRTARTS